MLSLFVLSLVQSVTEFLPVSSSGHLYLLSFFGISEQGMGLDVLLHLGTLFAVLISVVFALAGACVFRSKELNSTQRFAAIMIGFSIVFNVLSMRMEIWSRIAGMFSIYTYLLWVPEFTSEIHSVRNRWILNSSIALLALAYMLIVLIFRPEWTLVVPYMVRK